MTGKNIWIAVLSLILCVGGATAKGDSDGESAPKPQDNTAIPSSVTEIPGQVPLISLSYFGVYTGPAVTSPTRGGSIDSTYARYMDEDPQNLANQFKLDFNLTDNVFLGPVVNFQLSPIDSSGTYLLDSGVRIGHKKLFHSGNFNLMADFRVTGPMKPSFVSNNELLDLQTLNVVTYQVPHSRFTLGLLAFHYYQIYGGGVPTRNPSDSRDPRDFTLYFAPNVSYQITPSLSAVLYYEMYPYHQLGASWDTWTAYPADVSPGISWDITRDLTVAPQLVIYPSRAGLDNWGTIVYISAKML